MTENFIWFIKHVIGRLCVISGHFSGGILAANIAATSPEQVIGLVLEDPPFFCVLSGEIENTFVWKDGFEVTHRFLNQTEEPYYIPYYFENGYFWKLFQGLEQFLALFLCSLHIILRLRVPKRKILPIRLRQQLLMPPLLDYCPFRKHQNFLAKFTRRQPVTDINRRLISGDLVEPAVNLRFGNRIERRRWLI